MKIENRLKLALVETVILLAVLVFAVNGFLVGFLNGFMPGIVQQISVQLALGSGIALYLGLLITQYVREIPAVKKLTY